MSQKHHTNLPPELDWSDHLSPTQTFGRVGQRLCSTAIFCFTQAL